MDCVTEVSIGQCWLECIKKVTLEGDMYFDEDVSIKEIEGLTVKILKPESFDPIIEKYGDAEVVIHTLRKFSKGCVMKNRPFTYGQQIYDMNGIDQYDWLVERLKNKRETKSATICLMTPGLKDPNLPCLTTLDAKIRNNELNLQFFFRGQNIVGRQYANLIALAKFQENLSRELSVSVGFLAGYIASAHIYEYDFGFANSVVSDHPIRLKDRFYSSGPCSIRSNKLFH